jgi:hypothetical protein
VAQSTAEAEYMAAGNCTTQILWMIHTLNDYDLHLRKVPIMCDNTSAMKISKNLVFHSRTKNIEIRHHFIRDHVEKGDIELIHVDTKNQIADIFTKPLPTEQHHKLRFKLGMCATLFRAFRTAAGRWDAEEGHGDPSQACICLMPADSTV